MFPEDRFVEILIIGALALIVIGPKDLPVLMRRLGQFIGKMRGMAAEFRASFDELARQSELDDLRKEVEALRHTQAGALNPLGEAHVKSTFDDINQGLNVQMTPPMSHQIAPPEPIVETPPAPPEPEPAPKPKAPRKPRAKAAKTAGEPS
jgi:sec-independent protein translocase protein TatB